MDLDDHDLETALNGVNSEPDCGFIALEDHDLCHIDRETIKTLELLQNDADPLNKRHSLFGFMNAHTATTTGSRLLREGIMRPLCHLETLEHRLDCIEYLVNRPDTLWALANSIKPYSQNIDLDHVVPTLQTLYKAQSATLSMTERRLEALTILESLVASVDNVVQTLASTEQETLQIYMEALRDPAYQEILDDIRKIIEIDTLRSKTKRSKVLRIKQNVEHLFDIARSTYQAAIADLEQYVRDLQREDGMPWKLNHSENRGYFLSLTAEQLSNQNKLNARYIHVNRTRTQITCTTKELMQSNVRANVSYENSMKLANEILVNCIATIITKLESIHKLVTVIGSIDLITSFAKLVNSHHGKLVRPKFNATQTIVTQSRHPVLEAVLSISDQTVVPNDIVLAAGHKNFMLVTGPNMGGKSIFLKQVAVIQIMAQLGCYVPAESADIKLMNRIVARSGSTDDSRSNCSSFMWEMKGIASAIQRDQDMTHESVLYVIDEIGRGTTIDDGASYSFAIAEELALRRNCFTIFATHFDQVFYLTSLYGNVIAYHFNFFEDSEGRLKITHNLLPGFAEKMNYGIKLAESVGLPDEIMSVAKLGLEQGIY